MRRDAQRLIDIVEAASVVARYIHELTKDEFFAGGIPHDAILRQMTVAGEAAYKVSREIKARHQEIPWSQIAGFRHRLVHDYFGLDMDAVWHIATVELPFLRDQVIALLASEFPGEHPG